MHLPPADGDNIEVDYHDDDKEVPVLFAVAAAEDNDDSVAATVVNGA